MSLPLPEPTWAMPESIAGQWQIPGAWSSEQMQAYGQACRDAALEEAINCYSPDDTACSYIEKIEDLKS